MDLNGTFGIGILKPRFLKLFNKAKSWISRRYYRLSLPAKFEITCLKIMEI